MALHKPAKKLLADVPLKFVRQRVTGARRRALNLDIPLVPFIDFLITLVVFLLSSFGQEAFAQQGNLVLPSVVHGEPLAEAPIVSIDRQAVTLSIGETTLRITDTASLAHDARVQRLDVLARNLETAHRNWTVLHPNEVFPATVIVAADRNTDFRVVKDVLFSCAEAGYSNIAFAANRRARVVDAAGRAHP